MIQIKEFFVGHFNSFNRNPLDYCIDLAMRIVAVGFGLWIVLSAARCSVNMVSSAI